jgi:hypothetical protein
VDISTPGGLRSFSSTSQTHRAAMLARSTAMPVKSAVCNVHSVDSSSATTAEGLASFERHFSENFYYIWGYEYSKYRGDTSTRSTVHAHM